MHKRLHPLSVGLAALVLAACSSSSGEGNGGPGGSEGGLKVSASGQPVHDPTSVVVEFTGIEIQPQGGDPLDFDLDEAQSIDLLELQGNESAALLEDLDLEPGQYAFLKLKVNAEQGVMDSFIEFADGTMRSLFVPGGEEQGLRLVGGFEVEEDGRVDFTVDFDLRSSIHSPAASGGDYFLRPALRMVDNDAAGHLTGTVDEQIATAEPCFDAATSSTLAAIYIFEGSDGEPGDVCVSEEGETCPDDVDRPLTTTMVSASDADVSTFSYAVGFLLEGEYTAALTCDAAADDPESDDRDVVSFQAQQSFTVEAQQETELDFGIANGDPGDNGNGNDNGDAGNGDGAGDGGNDGSPDDGDPAPGPGPGTGPGPAEPEEGAF